MPDLESILQYYFGCKHPFKDASPHKLTVSGNNAYSKLCCLLKDLDRLGVISNSEKAINELECIVSSE